MATLSAKSIFRYALKAFSWRKIKETQTFFEPLTFPEELINQAILEFEATLSPDILMAFNGRFERGIDMAKQGMVSLLKDPVRPERDRLFRVRSSNSYRPPFSYIVDLDAQTCECPDYMKGHFCKHRVASHLIEIASQKSDLPEVDEEDELEPIFQGETITWAVIRHNGEILGVEAFNFEDDMVTVRALPVVKDGKKLLPRFPFADGKSSLGTVPKKELFHVKVFHCV